MKPLRLPALAAALVLAACSSPAPTSPSALGTEARLDEAPGVVETSTQEAGTGGAETGTVSGDTTGRGGNMLGSGN